MPCLGVDPTMVSMLTAEQRMRDSGALSRRRWLTAFSVVNVPMALGMDRRQAAEFYHTPPT